MARRLAQILSNKLGQPVNVVNNPGGNGQVSMAYVMSRPADGYTLMAEGTGITSVLQTRGRAFKWTQFEPVAMIERDAFALYVAAGSPYRTLEDLLTDART